MWVGIEAEPQSQPTSIANKTKVLSFRSRAFGRGISSKFTRL